MTRWLLGVFAFFTTVAVGTAVLAFDTNGGEISTLDALPSGPPRTSTMELTIGRTTLEDMLRDAPMAFVGTVTAIGGSEVISPSTQAEGPELTVHRTRFSVLRKLRGDVPDTVDITEFDSVDATLLNAGTTYLVFAEPRLLGSTRTLALTPFGYMQGIY